MGQLYYFQSEYGEKEVEGRSKRQVVFILNSNEPKPDDNTLTQHLLFHPHAIVGLLITPEFFEYYFARRGLVGWIKDQLKYNPVDYSEASFVVVECLYDEFLSFKALQKSLPRDKDKGPRFYFRDMWQIIYEKIHLDVRNEPPFIEIKVKQKRSPLKLVIEDSVVNEKEIDDKKNVTSENTSPLISHGIFKKPFLPDRSKSWTQPGRQSSALLRVKSADEAVLRKVLAKEPSTVVLLEPPKLF
jgi:hypothetical protein